MSQHAADSSPRLKTRRTNVGGKPFSSRNPTTIGAIGLVLILVLLWAAFNAASLPIIGSGKTYSAYFSEDAGLRVGDEVRIAGVKVGEVESIGISVPHKAVKVTFKIKNGHVGTQSTVAIAIKTLLGAKYLALDSIGGDNQNPHDTIPLTRTTSPFDVYTAFTALTHKIDSINTGTLTEALNTLASAFSDTPASVRSALDGLSRLSTTIASRDTQLQQLLAQANNVTGVLAARNVQLTKLFSDGNLILAELNARRDQIHELLINTTSLSIELDGLVQDNQKTIGPLLDSLQAILKTLNDNQSSLDQGLALLGPFYRVFNNTIGNGRWFDNYICNFNAIGIVGLVAGQIPDGGCS
jgi:phospholipid/cholesterol/gamma-HCH transport system substrate-binding protein